MFDSNRRRFPRANYPCQLTIWLADGGNETILANTSNIGINGLCAHLNQGIDPGTEVEVLLQFTRPSTPFKCTGMVVRSFKESDKYYNVGIQFDPLSELKYAFLEGKVSELIELEHKGKS